MNDRIEWGDTGHSRDLHHAGHRHEDASGREEERCGGSGGHHRGHRGDHGHHGQHGHRGRRGRGWGPGFDPGSFGRGWRRGRFDREEWLRRLESYQRDLEQETADVADLIRRLREAAPQDPSGSGTA